MKKQTIKQLALLGLASGLLAAATTAEAAQKSPANEGLNRAPNARSQPIAGCGGGGGCGAVADNYAPSGSSQEFSGGAGCARPSSQQSDPNETVQVGCASHEYSVNDANEQYNPERHGRPQVSQPQQSQQPQSSFRYMGDTTVPPDAMPSRNQPSTTRSQNTPSRFLSDTNTPPSSPSATHRPGSSPSSYSTTQAPSRNTMNAGNPNRPEEHRIESADRMYRPDSAPSTPPKSEAAKKTFW